MIQLLRQLNRIFIPRERWQFALLSLALIIRAGTEMLGVASIAPFMSVVADTSIIRSNLMLAWIHDVSGRPPDSEFLMILGIGVILVVAISNALSGLAVWAMLRFSWNTHHRISLRLLQGYLAQPYPFFLLRNSASLNRMLLVEARNIMEGIVIPVLSIISRSLVIIALVGLLIVLDPLLASIVALALGGSYSILYALVKEKQKKLGRRRFEANEVRLRTADEAFGGIKEIKVLQRESFFLQRFAPASWTFSSASAFNQTMAHLPRYLFETIALGGIVFIVLYHLRSGAGIAQILPVLSLYAFAGYRLMPELQQLFSAAGQVLFSRVALDELCDDLDRFENAAVSVGHSDSQLPLRESISVEKLTFRHAGSTSPTLDDVSLRIPRNQTVGLVGPTGSGKSTLVDLLLGLYEPDEGQIRVDSTILTEQNIAKWRCQIGYVPQQIFLCDDSIAANIAFGVGADTIDMRNVERAAKLARLDDFVQSLPGKYATVVGERGVRLSGGQRQRIGIARALFHDPAVLILDEATSALDGATESAVMDAIRELAGHKTVIIVAHRLSTLKAADAIFLLKDGKIQETGTFDLLMRESAAFRALASTSADQRQHNGDVSW